jgi:hypothetical protein
MSDGERSSPSAPGCLRPPQRSDRRERSEERSRLGRPVAHGSSIRSSPLARSAMLTSFESRGCGAVAVRFEYGSCELEKPLNRERTAGPRPNEPSRSHEPHLTAPQPHTSPADSVAHFVRSVVHRRTRFARPSSHSFTRFARSRRHRETRFARLPSHCLAHVRSLGKTSRGVVELRFRGTRFAPPTFANLLFAHYRSASATARAGQRPSRTVPRDRVRRATTSDCY